ncbi:hypothetical protein AAHC03_019086 [Spirometra sp. Aus1]
MAAAAAAATATGNTGITAAAGVPPPPPALTGAAGSLNSSSPALCRPPAVKQASDKQLQQACTSIAGKVLTTATFTATSPGSCNHPDVLVNEANKLGLTFSALSPQYPLLRETQETLAALSLNSPRPSSLGMQSTAAEPAPLLMHPTTSHEFPINSLEQAYDELLRLWVNTPATDWSSFAGVTADSTGFPSAASVDIESAVSAKHLRTALVFDPDLLKHFCVCPHGNNPQVHPECPIRIISILERIAISKMQIPSGLVGRIAAAAAATEPSVLTVSTESICLSETLPLLFYCRIMRGRMISKEELAVFHTPEHIARFGSDESSPTAADSNGLFATLPCGGLGVDSDTVWNPASTSVAARLAAGQVMCLAYSISLGHIRNGFALVHPPGHHAEPDQAMGFCYFNSVAVAALNVLKAGLAKRVMVLDWDIHHGNGTQLATAFHSGLLYVSLHRHDGGTFFPGTGGIQDLASMKKRQGYVVNVAWGSGCAQPTGPVDLKLRLVEKAAAAEEEVDCVTVTADNKEHCTTTETAQPTQSRRRFLTRSCSRTYSTSSAREVSGEDAGEDMNISPDSGVQMLPEDVAFCASSMAAPMVDADQSLLGLSDAEYLAAMRCIVLPMATEFNPDLVLISAGFDGATGHSHALGGYDLSPGFYAWMTRQCMSLAKGRVGLALEGGYVAASTAACVSACVNALLLPNPPPSTGVGEEGLAALDDCLITARSWIRTEELRRPPRPAAVQTLAEVARFHSEFGGWKCLRSADPQSMALPFETAILQERSLLLGKAAYDCR